MTTQLSTALVSLASIVVLWILSMGLYRRYRVDLFRNELFVLRDQLFDLGIEGRIAFNDEAYTTLRTMYNGYIRFGDRLSLSALIMFRLGISAEELTFLREQVDFHRRFARITAHLPADVIRVLQMQKSKMHDLVAAQIVFGSPFLVATLLPPAFMLVIMKTQLQMIARLRRRLRRAVADWVDEVALAIGEIAPNSGLRRA